MKKKLIIISIIIIILSSSAIYLVSRNHGKTLNRNYTYNQSKKNPPSTATPSKKGGRENPNESNSTVNSSSFGNSPSNILNGGLFLEVGSDLYYTPRPLSGTTDNSPMVHSLQDGVTNSSIIIKNSNVSDLNFIDGWIYFLMEGSGIYRCKPDGSEKTMVLSGDFADLICHKNDVYYIDSSGDLVKNDINNLENNQQIIDSALNFILSEDGSKLFYSQIQENKNQIMEYDLKTNKKILLVENSNSYLQAAFSYKGYLYFYEINKNQSNNVNPYQHMNLSKINIAIANSKVEQYMTDLSSENPLNENNGYIYYTKKISLGNKALAVRDLSNNEELSIPIKDDVIYDYQYSSYSLYAFDKTAYLYSNENYYVYIFDIENKSYKKVYLDADHATYQLNKN